MQVLKVQLLAPLDHNLTSYDIIIPKWLLEYVYIVRHETILFELRSEICCGSTTLPCTPFELQRKCRLLVGSEIHRIFLVVNVLGIDFLSLC